ncbi:AEC family transporter [Pseudomonas sp. UBA2684]|uniref:AEC family transporter n=1 Tax=Pseudomonas sp. UBA2684 TaxID=1947311 RepID=UPI000E92B78C|nr:AEC family transporter [Pseudomonas sp. UBA2684]HBX54638.1 AEC family transporter [Pseudomonas sp.]|tara:strand:+ start:28952 stop:29848 length:897 start_codon:yes stop_codon:yes gene_type:complete
MVAVQAILPIFGLIVLGYLLGWREWLSGESAAGLANITFKLFMPTLLFAGIAKASLADGLSPMLLLAYYLPVLLVFCLVNLIVHRQRGTATPLGLTAAFSNNVLVGIPLVTTLMGPQGLVYVFAILVFHSLTLFSLHSFYAAFGGQDKVDGKALLKNLANPMIIGLLLGALLNASGLHVPATLWRMVEWLAQAALPCALIVLGVSLSRYRLRPSTGVVGLALAKLVLFPAMVWWLSGQLPGLNEAARTVLVILAACPSGVNILAFAKTPEDTRSVSSAVFLSTVLAALTLPLWMLAVA